MEKVIIVGGGNAGTVLSNLLSPYLDVTVIEPRDYHVYQPGIVDYVVGRESEEHMIRKTEELFNRGVKTVKTTAHKVLVEDRTVIDERGVKYEGDYLVLATGGVNREFRGIKGYHELSQARQIREMVNNPKGKNFVIGSLPGVIKCPAAPWEMAFLIKGAHRDFNVTVIVPAKNPPPLQQPMSNAFSRLAKELGINVKKGFVVSEIEGNGVISEEGEKLPFDQLILDTPITSPFGDNLIHVDKETLKVYDGVYAIGDVNDVPIPKTGSAAHFQAEVVARDILGEVNGNVEKRRYAGEAMCAVYAGNSGLMIWMNYAKSKVLGPSPVFHSIKKAFTSLYWQSLYGKMDPLLYPMASYLES
ncbi:hypothetical protein HS7_13210 [Sulfolobales archaeon HS-7]|nr:hypothetical protein HS7_13210 [Sulfolobales archaeon HS-7]